MKKLALILLSTALIPVMALDWDYCAKIKADDQRLICFDRAYEEQKPSAEEVKTTLGDTGKWKVNIDESKFDGSKKVFAILYANEKVSGNYSKELPMLIIRCTSNKTEMLFSNFAGVIDYNYRTGNSTVGVKLGDGAPKSHQMEISEGLDAVFMRKPIGFIKSMFQKDRLAVKIPMNDRIPNEAVFNIDGLEEAIKPLREACNW